jgi:protein-tyrosine phosphatase
MAEALLARRFRGSAVTSVGLLDGGRPASTGSVRAMTARGIDIGQHISRRLEPADIEAADLVLGMAKVHVREAVVLVPPAFARSFTLPELVRRGEEVGPADDLSSWLGEVGRGRAPVDLIGDGGADDIPDPIGKAYRAYERTAVLLENLVDRLGMLIGNAVTTR